MSNQSLRAGFIPVVLAIVALVATPAFADDNELNVSSDKSKNPVTGTETVTKKYKRKTTNAEGKPSEEEVTEKTKLHEDGSVDKTVDSHKTEQPPVVR